MTGEVELMFRAKTLAEARETALTKWREVTESPEAELPPLTHIDLTQTGEDTDFLVVVRMDIDRVQIDKTGS